MAKVSLSRLSEILEKQNDNVFHVGIDVHKKSFHTAFYGNNGLLETFVCSSELDDFIRQLEPFQAQIVQVVYEAGPTGFELARMLEEAGFTVLVVAPRRLSENRFFEGFG